MADVSTAGTLGAQNDAVTLLVNRQRLAGMELTVPVAFVGTVLIEGTIDGTTFFNANCTDLAAAGATNSLTAAGRRLVTVSGYSAVRARCSAYTSGSCLVTLTGSP